MLGSTLDVAVGLALLYLLLSLLASAIREAAEGFVKSRAVQLERGIRVLLDDPKGDGLARLLYEHPLVASLYRDAFTPAASRFRGRNLPTYIPSRNFSAALLDMAVRGAGPNPYAAAQTAPVITVDQLRRSVAQVPSAFVRRALYAALDAAQGDVERARANVEAWYDSAMDRVSGWYKRRTQAWLLVIGFGTAAALHVNTLAVATYLARDPAARAALVRRAESVVGDSTYQHAASTADSLSPTARAAYADLRALDLPIGWQRPALRPYLASVGTLAPYVVAQLVGWLLTAAAVSFGAPFWFDVLSKIVIVRSTVKPREKGPEWGSRDVPNTTRVPASGPAAPNATPDVMPNAVTPVVVPPHADRAWKDGDPQEGVL